MNPKKNKSMRLDVLKVKSFMLSKERQVDVKGGSYTCSDKPELSAECCTILGLEQ
jgi:hypothetical protein